MDRPKSQVVGRPSSAMLLPPLEQKGCLLGFVHPGVRINRRGGPGEDTGTRRVSAVAFPPIQNMQFKAGDVGIRQGPREDAVENGVDGWKST